MPSASPSAALRVAVIDESSSSSSSAPPPDTATKSPLKAAIEDVQGAAAEKEKPAQDKEGNLEGDGAQQVVGSDSRSKVGMEATAVRGLVDNEEEEGFLAEAGSGDDGDGDGGEEKTIVVKVALGSLDPEMYCLTAVSE